MIWKSADRAAHAPSFIYVLLPLGRIGGREGFCEQHAADGKLTANFQAYEALCDHAFTCKALGHGWQRVVQYTPIIMPLNIIPLTAGVVETVHVPIVVTFTFKVTVFDAVSNVPAL